MRRLGDCFSFFFFFALLVLFFPALARAEAEDPLADMDIEQLMEVEVVTASRRAEPLTQVAGAVTVLTKEDIFRSGATNIPEALKLVPGVHVSQVDTDKWAVGIRGFNGLLSHKHLVLLDGRPMTSPDMGGVSWGNTIPISLIKRIEVVRGTWTSLWGAESFTGVINIITKTAAECEGGQSRTLVGTTGAEQIVRFGDQFGDSADVMGYFSGSYKSGDWVTNRDNGRSSRDWAKTRAGFRSDWENAYTDALSLQGNSSHHRLMTEPQVSVVSMLPSPTAPIMGMDNSSGTGPPVWMQGSNFERHIPGPMRMLEIWKRISMSWMPSCNTPLSRPEFIELPGGWGAAMLGMK